MSKKAHQRHNATLSMLKTLICSGLLLFFVYQNAHGQSYQQHYYEINKYSQLTDSLQKVTGANVVSDNQSIETALLLALTHYPELHGNTYVVRIKKNVKHPITASWSLWNVFKKRKNHKYVLLLSEDSFLLNISLNEQVGAIGHELAHYAYYKSRPAIGMLTWGIQYTFSKQYRIAFERDADITTLSHGLGWQLLNVVYYHSQDEIKDHMMSLGYELTP